MKINYDINIDDMEYVYNPTGECSEEVSEEDYEFIKTSLENYQKAIKLLREYSDKQSKKEAEENFKYEQELKKNDPQGYEKLKEAQRKAIYDKLNEPCLCFDMIPKMPLKQGYRAGKK